MVTKLANQVADEVLQMLDNSGLSLRHRDLAGKLAIGLLDSGAMARTMLCLTGHTEAEATRIVEAAFAICLRTESAAREHAVSREAGQ